MDTLAFRLAVAFAIGLLVGIERGWKSRDSAEHQRAAGFRTFALSGLLGGVAAALAQLSGPIVLAVALVAFAGIFGAFQWLEARFEDDLSVTSAVAGLLTFLLGAYAVLGNVQIAIGCAIAMTAALALREPLHRWVASLQWKEIRAALVLLAMTFLLLPILPHRTIDPWDALNPSEIWLFAILIAAISFVGYVAMRVFGERKGVVATAIAGGLTSSTATTLTLARLAGKESVSPRVIAGGIVLSGTVMVARVGVLSGIVNQPLALRLAPALLAAVAVQAIASALLLFRHQSDEKPELEIHNPLEIATALKMAAIIAVIMLASKLALDYLGDAGVLATAGISGLADVDAITLSMARLSRGSISPGTAIQAIAIAVAVNTLVKAAMALVIGGSRIGIAVAATSVAAIVAGGAVIVLL